MILPAPHRCFGLECVWEMCPRPQTPAVASKREPAFAKRLRVSIETLRNWEQGKRHPQGSARALFRVIDKAPDAAMAVLDHV